MPQTKPHIDSRNKITILIGFFTVLILLGSLMTIAVNEIQHNEQQLLAVTQELTEVGHAYVMRDAANNRALILYRMAQTDDDFYRDDLYTEFRRYGSTFMVSFNAVNSSIFRQKDIELFKLAKKSIQKGGQSQTKTAINLIEGDLEIAQDDLANKIIPIQTDVRNRLTALSDSLRNNADNDLKSISNKNSFSILLIRIIGGTAILLGLVITFYVTRRVTKTEAAFQEQRYLTEKASQAKSMFLATMSHEIRSPLAAIIGFSDLLRKQQAENSKLNTFTESIYRNSKHLLQLINDILDITKIEAGQLNIEIITTSLFSVLDEFQSTIISNVHNKGLKFELNFSYPMPKNIKTDPIRLKQILYNLTNNAIKFTDEGCININVSYDQYNEKIVFDIIDTGIGLTPKQQEKIFESFTQADSSTTRKYGGSGLGLNICKQLSEKLGGKLWVESSINHGSKFSFNINSGEVAKEQLIYSANFHPNEQDKKIADPKTKLQGHVLLAEDTIDNQNLIEMYVTQTGANITIVNNGAQAVKICEEHEFDLILMDMQMPVMDGIEATKAIRSFDSKIPIISLTANAMRSDYEKCIDAGATEFMTKPIDIEQFNQTLLKYLSNIKGIVNKKNMPTKIEQLSHKFIVELPERLKLINQLHQQKSWFELESETHKLKAIGTPLGFPKITEISEQINLSCRNNDFNAINESMLSLNDFCNSILE
ncbi:hypothetical protein MNBD_GAMMA22-127 [hydrothermal vent metagenome]|uniref:histidine kinase n=1 Tax=hydrothermal vent metagenome TaxID=652676 RepID=A0A3B1ALN2_9ZZZZ